MSDICDNMYYTCNMIIINIAWYAEQIFTDLNAIKKDLFLAFEEEDKSPSQNHGRTHLVRPSLLTKYNYPREEEQKYFGDEDWLEPWDKV